MWAFRSVGSVLLRFVVWTDDHAVAFLASYNTLLGHTLVAPRAHREQATGDFKPFSTGIARR